MAERKGSLCGLHPHIRDSGPAHPCTAASPRARITMLIDGADPSAAAKPDERLIKLLIRVRRFNALTGSDGVPFASFAEQEGVSPSYFTRLVRLSYLAPDITQPIRDERQAPALTQTSCRNTRDCRWLSSSSGTSSVLREPISALSFIL